MNCSVAASKLTNWPTAWCPFSPPSPSPYYPDPHNATVALPLLLSLFRLLAACECRCGCRFLSPINFLLIRSLFLHTLSHTRTADVHAQQIMQSSNAHTYSYSHLLVYVIIAEYTFMHTYEGKRTKMMMLFQWNMTLRYIRNYLRYSLRWATSSNFRSEQCSQLFHLPPFPCHSLPVGTSVTRKINTKKEKTRSKMKTCIKCKVCANKLPQRATGYPRKPRGRGGLWDYREDTPDGDEITIYK